MEHTKTTYTIFSDGGSRGNPGPAAFGYVIYDPNGERIAESAQYIGITTNNQAEYQGITAALEALQSLQPTAPVVCKLDSQLVVRQIQGIYRLKHEALRPWLSRIQTAIKELPVPISFCDVPRSENREADALVNKALDAVSEGAH